MRDTEQAPDAPSAEASDPRSGDIQAVSRCGQVLALLAERDAVRAADVEAGLDLQRSTAHRYLASMASAGLVERGEDGAFIPGPLLVHLGAAALRRSRILEIAGPYMEALAREAHETVVLSLWGGATPVVARVAEDASRLTHVSVREGVQLPAHAAQTQVFLAHLPDRQLVSRLTSALPTAVRRDVDEGIAQVHASGLGENAEVMRGIRTIAAPVFDRHGVIRATLAFVGTVEAIPAGADSGLARALRATAEQISNHAGDPASHRDGTAGGTEE